MINPFKLLVKNTVVNFRLKKFVKYEQSYDFVEELKKVKKVLIILPQDEEYSESMMDFTKRIGNVFKKARVSTFTSASLRKSELTWFGIPNEQYLRIIREEQFDLVLDINPRQDIVCSYLCALSGAPTRLNLSSGTYDYIYNLYFKMNNIPNINGKLDNVINYLTAMAANN